MRITDIQADNILAIKSINLKLRTAVSLICGANGSAKSSIFDIVSLALAHVPMRKMELKKELCHLVHDGSKAGGGLVLMDENPDFAYGFNLPKGEFIEPAPGVSEFRAGDAMRVALNGQNFARMDAKERLVFLRTLTKIRSNKEAIIPMLLEAAGCPLGKVADVFKLLMVRDFAAIDQMIGDSVAPALLPKVEEITAQLRGGFTGAEDYAKDRALESKRLWCATTGKKSWGKLEAEGWEMELPVVPAGDIAALNVLIAAQDTAIDAANQSIGAINQITDQAKADAEIREKLKDAPARVTALQEQVAEAEKNVAELLPKVEALRDRAQGTARVGLVHDMALFMWQHPVKDAKAALLSADLIGRYQDEHGSIADMGKIDAEAQAEYPVQRENLQKLQNEVTALKRQLDSAIQARGQFDALAPAGEAVDASAELAEVRELLAAAQAEKQRLQNAALDIQAAHKNRAEAEKKNAAAKAHHADIVQWLFIAEQMAPAGIPGRLLSAALKPVNATLAQAHADTEGRWPLVVIQDDMEIIVGGRMYALRSESEQYRADAMIAQMVATISGIKIILLDRFDMLDLKGRAELFTWLDTLVTEGDIDTAMIFGTLKELPRAGLLDSFTAYWVEGGEITEVSEPAPAEAEAA